MPGQCSQAQPSRSGVATAARVDIMLVREEARTVQTSGWPQRWPFIVRCDRRLLSSRGRCMVRGPPELTTCFPSAFRMEVRRRGWCRARDACLRVPKWKNDEILRLAGGKASENVGRAPVTLPIRQPAGQAVAPTASTMIRNHIPFFNCRPKALLSAN